MKSKRICMLISYLHPVFTGDGIFLLNLGRLLSRQGYKVSFVTARHTASPIVDSIDQMQVVRLPTFGSKKLKTFIFALEMLLLFPLLIRKVRIVQCQTDLIIALPAMLWGRLLGKKTIFRFTLMTPQPLGILRRKLWHMLFVLSNQIICLSPFMEQWAIDRGVSASKITVIPQGTNHIVFKPTKLNEKINLRNDLGLPIQDLLVTFVGGIIPRKGVDLLLEAWKLVSVEYPTAQLLLVGPIYIDNPELAEFYQRLKDKIGKSQLQRKVHFIGMVDNVVDYLRASDIFVLPSIREGLPSTLLEAMSCGLPCIITSFLGYSEYIARNSEEIIVVPRDADALSQAIINLLKSQELRMKLGAKARKRIEAKFSINIILQRYVNLFQDLISR